MKTIKIISLLVSLCISTVLFGQTQNLRGRVVDATTKYPLIGAVVSLVSNSSIATVTNEYGQFVLPQIPYGRQSIEISYVGYKTQTIDNLLFVSAKEVSLEIQLEEEAIKIDEVVIKANVNHALNEMASSSARAISIEQTERFAGSLGDPARMAANYAGVSSKDDSRNDIVIRGNSPSGVLWRLEGIEIPNPNHFGSMGATGGPVSMINNNLLSTSDFITGAFPAEYGNALAGAFDLHMRSGNSDKHEFLGQVGFGGFEFGAEGPLTKGKPQNASYLLSFRYSTLQVMDELGFDLGTGSAVPKYKDLTYMINIPTQKYGRFKVFGLWGNSFIQMGRDYADTTENKYSERGSAIDFGSGLGVAGVSHTYFFNPKSRLITTISYQTSQSEMLYDSISKQLVAYPFVRQFFVENKTSISQQYKYKMNSKHNFSVGYTIDNYSEDFIDSLYLKVYDKFISRIDVNGTLNLLQANAQWQYKINNKLTNYVGVHSQYFSLNEQTVVEPRYSLDYKISPKQSVNFGFGIHNQTQPRIAYFYQVYDSVSDSYSKHNENLKFTQNIHYILGYQIYFAKHCKVKSEFYYQELSNAPVSSLFEQFSFLNAGADFVIPNVKNLENSGTGTNKGVEITFERFLHNGYYVLVTGSLFDSKYKGYDKVERNTAFNGNFIFNCLGGYEYKISDKYMLTFDLKGTYAGGKRYVPIDLAKSIAQNETVYDWDNMFAKRYDDYFRADLRIGFKQNGKRFSQEWGLDLQNITNYKSVFSEGFDVEKGEIYKSYQQGFMPMMLYRIQF